MNEIYKKLLLPCPFCGKNDELEITHIYEGETYIGCDRCKYDGVHISVWNARVYPLKEKTNSSKHPLAVKRFTAGDKGIFHTCANCGKDNLKIRKTCKYCGSDDFTWWSDYE